MQQRDGATDVLMPLPGDETASTVQGGLAYLADMAGRLAPHFARSEPRQRVMVYVRGLLSSVERKNSWQLAEVSGDATPYGFQYLLGRADWEADAVRDELRHYLVQHLGTCMRCWSSTRRVSQEGPPLGGRRPNTAGRWARLIIARWCISGLPVSWAIPCWTVNSTCPKSGRTIGSLPEGRDPG